MYRFAPTIILAFLSLLAQAQPVFHLDSLPAAGVLLDKGWTYHAGDNPDFARPEFDDKSWEPLNPSLDIFELPQVPKTGKIGWLRLHLTLDSTVLQSQLALIIQQSVASEYYLNGKLIQVFGKLGQNSNEIEAFDPLWKPVSFPINKAQHQVLAIRFALKPAIHYTTIFETSNPVATIQLLRTEEAVTIYTNLRVYTERFTMTQLGVWIMLFVLNFIFFLPNRDNKSRLYFAIFALFFLIGDIIQLDLYILENDVANKFYVGNWVFVFYVFGEFSLMAAIYAVFERKRDLAFWLVAGYIIPALLLDSLVYGWGWQSGGPMLEIFVHLNVIRIAVIAILKKKRNAYIIAGGAITSLFFFVLFLRMGTFYNHVFLLALTNLRIAYYFLFIYCIPISAFIYLGLDFAFINKELKKNLEENEKLAKEKQQILSSQNETLEKQVIERTVELVSKNRDLEIEAALEKIRSCSLTMYRSDKLQEVVVVVFEKLKELGLVFDGGAGIQLFTENSKDSILWVASPGQIDSPSRVNLPYDEADFTDNPIILDVWHAKETGEAIYNKTYTRDEKNRYFHYVFKHNDLVQIPQFLRDEIYKTLSYTQAFVVEKHSGVIANSWSGEVFPPDEFDVFKRIAKVFEQAYIRFLDLQKAEASAKEAIRQAALDRVRAEIAAMRTVGDLQRITPIIWQELRILGIAFIRCGVFIMDDPAQQIHTFLSTPDGNAIASFHLDYAASPPMTDVVAHWHQNLPYTSHWNSTEFTAIADSLLQQEGVAARAQYLAGLPHEGIYPHFLPFRQGMLYVGNTQGLTDEEMHTVQSVADAFATAYARYEDFNRLEAAKQQVDNTLVELKQTQQQLIQKEKLASLGELTAGIAHEIQNPLNFVNNFSEVSTELVSELKDELDRVTLDRVDTTEAKAIADDLTKNLQKITLHGGRASAIVKGMLEHSRTSTGEKNLTDLNALAGEYLRLAYQGMRRLEGRTPGNPVKDKHLHTELVTDLDADLPQVAVVAPEIGRVLLNLFNNAFYTVQQKQKTAPATYQPTVSVSTRQIDHHIEIRVEDNGIGIPDTVKDKIFQPFFTTKPTGEGTGLGLSLAYDIITKGHGGTLTVESTAGEGTTFIVKLPV